MTTDTVIYCDGLCEPFNPGGTATYGYVIYWKGKRARNGSGVICTGPGATNNLAEYTAVIKALEHLIDKKYLEAITVRSDSQLVINQLAGSWNVNSPNIIPLWQQARGLVEKFKAVSFEWVPREENKEADLMSRAAYNQRAR